MPIHSLGSAPLQVKPVTDQRQRMDGAAGMHSVRQQVILDFPQQHPVRISLREGLKAQKQTGRFNFLEASRSDLRFFPVSAAMLASSDRWSV